MDAERRFKDVLDAEAWVYISRILKGIPAGFSVASCADDASLIHGLGNAGAYSSLIALQEALGVYFSDLIFAAVRASFSRPLVVRSSGRGPELDDAEWERMFAVPWEAAASEAPAEGSR